MRVLLAFSVVLFAGLSRALDTPAPPATCLNGGVQQKDDKSMCDCQSYWGGEDCGTIVCVNGGYATPVNDKAGARDVCHCPKGYYGIHCDAVKQARPVQGVFKTVNSFNLYIHNELTDWYGMKALQRIKNETRNIINDYKYAQFNLFESKRLNTVQNPADVWVFTKTGNATIFLNDNLDKIIATRTRTYTCTPAPELSYKKLHDELEKNGIEDGVILMFTQYPPKSDADALRALKEYLRAFRIKLNVIIGADDILLDCYSKKNNGAGFDELTELVHFTDGEIATFLIEDDDSPDELLPSFIRASASPQSHSRAASESCAIGLKYEFQTDPYPNTYFITVRTDEDDAATITGTCSSGGEVTPLAVSTYHEFAVSSILSGAQQTCKITVQSKGGCLSTVYSVGGEKDVDKFDIFHSFATSEYMDSDSIHSFKTEEYFLNMHIDISSNENGLPKYLIVEFGGVVMVKNENGNEQEAQVVFEKNLFKRESTFDYQSEVAFTCPENGISWVQLNLEGFNINGDSLAVLNRIIHLNCEERKPANDGKPKMLRMMEDATTNKLPTLALMYSNEMPTPQFSRFILEGVNEKVIKDKFSNYGYLRFDGKESMDFEPTDDFQAFRKDVYDFAPDSSIPYQASFPQSIQKLTANPAKAVTSDSLVSIAIKRPQINPEVAAKWATNLAELANLGAKMLFWGDVDTVKIDQESDSLGVYIRMAAMSAGHVVLIDMDDFSDVEDENGDNPFYVSLALHDLYSFGPSQRLLSYSNLEWTQTSTQTSQSAPIGTLQIPDATTEVFVSITLNVEDPQDVAPAFMLSIVLDGFKDRIVLNLDAFTQYGTPGYIRSNLYTTNFTVVGGESYEGTFTVLAMTRFTGTHIRFWTARADGDIIPKLKYVDFNEGTVQPDDYLGAALRVPDSEGETMSLRIYDKNGVETKRLDHNQTVDVTGGVAHFVPYFCNSNQSTATYLTTDLYTIEITYATGFKYFRPLMCSKGKPNERDCQQVTNDNTYCVESNPPFHRGPSQKLVDCSGVGQVKYTDVFNKDTYYYKCFCNDGFAGDSCEQSSCAPGIEHLPALEDDASFRTLSYVLLSPAGEDYCSSLKMFYADDAKKLFKEGSAYNNIWQYTFSVYFTDGTAKTMYRGPSFDDFYKQFGVISDEDFDIKFCGSEKNKKATDLNDVFNLAVESVGRNSRGIVLMYAAQTFFEQNEETELKDAFASSELYQSIQAYQQQIYMVTPTVIPDFISMTTASGGMVTRLLNDYEDFDTPVAIYRNLFDELLTSQIGWAGVSTEAKTSSKEDESKRNSWNIRQDADLFITTRTAGPDGKEPIVKKDGTPLTGMDTFYLDASDEDTTVSRHTAITVTNTAPVIIEITFDDDKKTDLVQVVILTKAKPIRTALIGQSQVNADKQAAAATNSSEKAVHISFNKLDTEMYFKPADDNWRQASRLGCNFAQEFVAFVQPFKNVGSSVVDFTVSPMKAQGPNNDLVPDNTSCFSLAVPLAVSETIDCINGDFVEEGSYCKCNSAEWSGPTCAQPSCGEGGSLNSHGDHCDCTGAEFGGLFCREEKKASFFEE